MEYADGMTREQWLDAVENGPNKNPFYQHPEPGQQIWRYMDFAKFVDLIDSSALFCNGTGHS